MDTFFISQRFFDERNTYKSIHESYFRCTSFFKKPINYGNAQNIL